MKELSIEEKAKAYDELLVKLQKAKVDNNVCDDRYCCVIDDIVPELKESEDERIRKALVRFHKGTIDIDGIKGEEILAWLEKQCEQKSKKISLWKHWKDGIAGNGEGKIIYLVKMDNTYRLTSCLGFECDYIELSELDNLLLEKQGEREPKFRIGDTIKKKSTDDIVTVSEVDLKNREYRLSNTGFIPFKYEYLWELVEQKSVFEMKTPKESLGVDSDTYNKIVDECVYGEQKPADKVEPKFKIGDLITNGILVGKIDEIHEWGYHAYFGDYYADVPDAKNWRKWTIQDAKDGDVLYCESGGIEYIVMSKGINERGNIDSYFRYNSLDGFDVDIPSVLSASHDNITPATKEQRDLLFHELKEAGYEWDAEKKELKKIEQKPAWSEEDTSLCTRIQGILSVCKSHGLLSPDLYKEMCDGLKFLKERYTWKPTTEQLRELRCVISGCSFETPILVELEESLKKLKG